MGSETMSSVSKDNIKGFYKDSCVFVTGATGFIGKAVVEKLLRTCEDVSKIYVLIRGKREKSAEERLQDVLSNPVFDVVRKKFPHRLNKVEVVKGDVTLPNLGLDENDKPKLISTVDIVLHCAANVRFTANLKEHIVSNTIGTKNVLTFCAMLKKIKSFIYVSTAFSNADKHDVDETVYNTDWDVGLVLKYVQEMPPHTLEMLTKDMLGKHPNTYTFSKALAENVIQKYSWPFPIAIVRPSIVTCSWKEPFPGWIDSILGVTGFMVEIGRGSVRSMYGNPEGIADLIPVDIVVNTIVTSAWYMAVYRSKGLVVFNCTSGAINKVYWKEVGSSIKEYSVQYPTKYLNWYPEFSFHNNIFLHRIVDQTLQKPLALCSDIVLSLFKKKPMMVKIYKKFQLWSEHIQYFTASEWNFHVDYMKHLIYEVNNSKDKQFFELDISKENGFDWNNYFKIYMIGIRKHILKENPEPYICNKVVLHGFYWANVLLQLCSAYVFVRILQYLVWIPLKKAKIYELIKLAIKKSFNINI